MTKNIHLSSGLFIQEQFYKTGPESRFYILFWLCVAYFT